MIITNSLSAQSTNTNQSVLSLQNLPDDTKNAVLSFLSPRDMTQLFQVNRSFYSIRQDTVQWIRKEYEEECTKIFQQVVGKIPLFEAIFIEFSKDWTLETLEETQKKIAETLFKELSNREELATKRPQRSFFRYLEVERIARSIRLTQVQSDDLKRIDQLIAQKMYFSAERVCSFIEDGNTRFLAQKRVVRGYAKAKNFKECVCLLSTFNEVYKIEQVVKAVFKDLLKDYEVSELYSMLEPDLSLDRVKYEVKQTVYTQLIRGFSLAGDVKNASSLLFKIEREDWKNDALKSLAEGYAITGDLQNIRDLAFQSSSQRTEYRIFVLASKKLIDCGHIEESLELASNIEYLSYAKSAYLYLIETLLKRKNFEKIRDVLEEIFRKEKLTPQDNLRILEVLVFDGQTELVLSILKNLLEDPLIKDYYFMEIASCLKETEKYEEIALFLKEVQDQGKLFKNLEEIFRSSLKSFPQEVILSLIDLIVEPTQKDQMIENLMLHFFKKERASLFEELIFKSTNRELRFNLYNLVYSAYESFEEKSRLWKRVWAPPSLETAPVSFARKEEGRKRQKIT